jgi:hypothetical protein
LPEKGAQAIPAEVPAEKAAVTHAVYEAPKPATEPGQRTDDVLPAMHRVDTSAAVAEHAPPAQQPTESAGPSNAKPPPGHYGHSGDYSCLHGDLEHFGKTWRLRYASLDEVDAYGGCVSLPPDRLLEHFKDGEHVCVKGRLLAVEGPGTAPPYRVESIEAISER